MIEPTAITGVLLAGGQSRRMFPGAAHGGDKCLEDLEGRPMLAHVIERLAPQVGRIVLNANGDPVRFAGFPLPVVADTVAGFAGPLAGLLAGLRWSRAHAEDATHVATVSTDAPFIPGDLVGRLAAALPDQSRGIAIARSASGLHPVIGLWPRVLADDLEAALAAGVRKVQDWTARHRSTEVCFETIEISGSAVDPFFNANRPEDLEIARRLLARMRQAT